MARSASCNIADHSTGTRTSKLDTACFPRADSTRNEYCRVQQTTPAGCSRVDGGDTPAGCSRVDGGDSPASGMAFGSARIAA